jgi:hypothetical protein
MSTITEYPSDDVKACLAVLLELLTYLKPYQDHIVLIGGWAPYFLTQRDTGESPHQGSLDIDLALNPMSIPVGAYETILEILQKRGYEPKRNTKDELVPASYIRTFTDLDGREHMVQVDLMSPEYGGTAAAHRHQPIQDILARKARGVDLAFTSPVEKRLEGYLPNQAKNAVTLRIANIVACFTMKATTFHMRGKEKDAYDLYILIKEYPNGINAVVTELRKYRDNRLVKEALTAAAESFESTESMGPIAIADFLELAPGEERDVVIRDAYEIVNHILNLVRAK